MGYSRATLGTAPLRPAQETSLSSLIACGEVASGLRVEVGPLTDCRSEHREAVPDSLFPSPLENLSFRRFYLLF